MSPNDDSTCQPLLALSSLSDNQYSLFAPRSLCRRQVWCYWDWAAKPSIDNLYILAYAPIRQQWQREAKCALTFRKIHGTPIKSHNRHHHAQNALRELAGAIPWGVKTVCRSHLSKSSLKRKLVRTAAPAKKVNHRPVYFPCFAASQK